MLQRQPRVGDIVDDYCPRERRVSDHVVVAMVDDGIRQTRCTACDTEHEYREGKVPPSRKKTAMPLPPKPPAAAALAAPKAPDPQATAGPQGQEPAPAAPEVPVSPAHEGHVHRRLIRAVLPRVEGEIPTRQAPEFTMHRAAERQGPGRNQRPGQGGQPRHGAKGPGGPGQRPGSRGSGGHSTGQRGGRGGFGGPGGPGGQGGHGGPRHGRPHGAGPGARKKH